MGKKYTQDWSAYNASQENELLKFMDILKELCRNVRQLSRDEGSGRQPEIDTAEMIFLSALKVYSTFSLRRFQGMAKIAQKMDYIDDICSYSSISNYMRKEDISPIIQRLIVISGFSLRDSEDIFAVDSSGFSSCRFGRYFNFRHGKDKVYRKWIKAHVICGVKTNIITNVRISDGIAADTKFLEPLVEDTSKVFRISEVLADKAYSTRRNYYFVRTKGGKAFIPFRVNARKRARGCQEWRIMCKWFLENNEDFLNHYHKRSNAETVFHMIKTKFRDSLMSKDETAQKNELLLKILCHNICVVIHESYENHGKGLKSLCLYN